MFKFDDLVRSISGGFALGFLVAAGLFLLLDKDYAKILLYFSATSSILYFASKT